MPECPKCGKKLEETVRFCPDDGTPLTETAAASGLSTPTDRKARFLALELPQLLGNRYRLVQCLGGGGMAQVYRAIDTTLEREVAVKLINPELREDPEFDSRFQREARIASQLSDPHIVVVHDFGLDPKHGPYLVMEYLRGESLRSRLAAQGPMPLRAVLQLTAQLTLALIHAHDKGIVHRDIKPDNIFLLDQSGVRLHVRVLDFGIARIYRADETTQAETLTRPGAVLGTPRYMSPEQLAGLNVDGRSDLYSAALVIYESLTGTLPYVSNKKLVEHCPEIPPAFHDVIEQCLEQKVAERPPSALEVYLRIQEPCRASGILLLPPGAMEKLAAARQMEAPTVAYPVTEARQRPLRWWYVAGGILLAVAALVVLGLLWLKKPTVRKALSRETLLGLEIGATLLDVNAVFKHEPTERPPAVLESGRAIDSINRFLKPEDLGTAEERARCAALIWMHGGGRAVVVLLDDHVRAVIITAPYRGATSRGLKIGDSESYLKDVYPERPDVQVQTAANKKRKKDSKTADYVQIYRYEALGICFEIQNKMVTAIALFPPVQAGEPPLNETN